MKIAEIENFKKNIESLTSVDIYSQLYTCEHKSRKTNTEKSFIEFLKGALIDRGWYDWQKNGNWKHSDSNGSLIFHMTEDGKFILKHDNDLNSYNYRGVTFKAGDYVSSRFHTYRITRIYEKHNLSGDFVGRK